MTDMNNTSQEPTAPAVRRSFIKNLLLVLLILAACVMLLPRAFFRASVRAPAATVNSDQRNISIALESYYLDRHAYPLHRASAEKIIGSVHVGPIDLVARDLTTPVQYITTFLNDPWEEPYRYATDGENFWVVWCGGKDEVDNIMAVADLAFAEDATWRNPTERLARITCSGLTYNASNGTVSGGDIWRTGP